MNLYHYQLTTNQHKQQTLDKLKQTEPNQYKLFQILKENSYHNDKKIPCKSDFTIQSMKRDYQLHGLNYDIDKTGRELKSLEHKGLIRPILY